MTRKMQAAQVEQFGQPLVLKELDQRPQLADVVIFAGCIYGFNH